MNETCQWDVSQDGCYETECGHMFEFTNGDLKDNDIHYCPFCGRHITED